MAAADNNPLNGPTAKKFHWVSNGEPHAIRRREMLSKYGPQIRKLYGYDHSTARQVQANAHAHTHAPHHHQQT
jgi:hypothetical protein